MVVLVEGTAKCNCSAWWLAAYS